ncbi:GntR family transcriptional regulator [Lysinibacillus sp. NPDC097214]|uniref:GntR family transcriptional regulator n=1 Tax=Lysinibacillus sp. NPDC097214 TaxID=3390584 RepID=UPI003CFCD4C8
MTSLADQAYEILLERCIKADYMPGEKLSENKLSDDLNMSRTPIRTALIRLIRKNYIQSIDKKGIIVKGFSQKTFLDTCFFLADLQQIVLTGLIQKNNVELLKMLDGIIAEQIKAHEQNDYYRYLICTYDYMEKTFESYNNEVLLQAFKNVRQNTTRMSMIIYNLTKQEPHYSTISMFQALNEGLKQQNPKSIHHYLLHNKKRMNEIQQLFNVHGEHLKIDS